MNHKKATLTPFDDIYYEFFTEDAQAQIRKNKKALQ